jgi:hypothetical protein
MVSTQRPSQAEQVASNAWPRANGGFIFADVPNVVTSAAVIVHQISMHRNTTPPRVTRSSRASSRASSGFTTIAQKNPSSAQSFTLLTRIRWINRRPGRPERCLQTGKRCFTNRGRLLWFPISASQGPRLSIRRGALPAEQLRKQRLRLLLLTKSDRSRYNDRWNVTRESSAGASPAKWRRGRIVSNSSAPASSCRTSIVCLARLSSALSFLRPPIPSLSTHPVACLKLRRQV